MESVAYQAKRAHWGITWFAIRTFRAAARERGKPELEHMTPARFDIMALIEMREPWTRPEGSHPQMQVGEIVERLGLSPSTISKTISGMVRRGFVERFDHPGDGRRVIVGLTDWGEKAYLAARAMLKEDRFLRDKLEKILTTLGKVEHPQKGTVEEHRANGMFLEHRRLRTVARDCGYWADDIHEPDFDGTARSPLQHVFDEINRQREDARRRARSPSRSGGTPRDVALWEFWGTPRPFRQNASRWRD